MACGLGYPHATCNIDKITYQIVNRKNEGKQHAKDIEDGLKFWHKQTTDKERVVVATQNLRSGRLGSSSSAGQNRFRGLKSRQNASLVGFCLRINILSDI